MPFADFEIKLAQAADAEISQTIPSIMDYKVGFQLIDKNDEETRGLGACIYKIGDTWVQIPVFYLNGKLKGYHIMLLPDKAQFLPSKDNWLSTIIHNKPIPIGKLLDKSKDFTKGPEETDLDDEEYSAVSIFKKAGDVMRGIVKEASDDVPDFQELDLKNSIPKMGSDSVRSLLLTMKNDPVFANAVYSYYSPGDIEKIAETAEESDEQSGVTVVKTERYHGDVKVITLDDLKKDSPEVGDMNDKEKETLLKDTYYIIDRRPINTTVYRRKDPASSGPLQDITENGTYIIPTDRGIKTAKVYVARKTGKTERYVSNSKKGYDRDNLYLIKYDKIAKPYISHCESLRGIKVPKSEEDTLVKTGNTFKSYSGLINSISAGGEDIEGLFIYSPEKEKGLYVAGGRLTIINGMPSLSWSIDEGSYSRGVIEESSVVKDIVVADNKIIVPKGSKYYTRPLEFVTTLEEEHKATEPPVPLDRVTMDDWYGMLTKEASMTPLKIYSKKQRHHITGCKGEYHAPNTFEAVKKLVMDYKIRPEEAKNMVPKYASSPETSRYTIKLAADPIDMKNLITGGPEAIRTTSKESTKTVQPMEINVIQAAVNAAENGMKEVMDVTILKGLAETNNAGRIVDSDIKNWIQALSKVGRALYLYYWHYDDFADKYGEEKMDDLESTLRNLLSMFGDYVLFISEGDNGKLDESFDGELSEEILGEM